MAIAFWSDVNSKNRSDPVRDKKAQTKFPIFMQIRVMSGIKKQLFGLARIHYVEILGMREKYWTRQSHVGDSTSSNNCLISTHKRSYNILSHPSAMAQRYNHHHSCQRS